jgi:spermidine/putrescine transport system substrate-binding protein
MAPCQTNQDPNNIQDIEAVWGKVRDARDMTKKYWSSGAELMDLLAKEEIVVTEPGRAASRPAAAGPPIGYLDPQGQLCLDGGHADPQGSPMAECEELINFMLDPATAIAVAEGRTIRPRSIPRR